MSDHKDRLADYVEVPDRIRQFKEQFPDGSLQPADWTPEFRQMGDRTFIVYTALAYRTPDDSRPGIGMAWEPYPGKTPYTKDSELMNAETSAWGRALAALGFVGKKGAAKVATKEEVQARQSEGNGKPKAAITVERAHELLAQAEAAKVDHRGLSMFLTSKGVSHAPLEDDDGAVAALALLHEAQADELAARLEKKAAA